MSETVQTSKFKWSDLYKKEDWWAIWLGFVILILAIISKTSGAFTLKAFKPHKGWGTGDYPTIFSAFDGVIPGLLFLMVFLGVLFGIGIKVMGGNVTRFATAFPVIFILQHCQVWSVWFRCCLVCYSCSCYLYVAIWYQSSQNG